MGTTIKKTDATELKEDFLRFGRRLMLLITATLFPLLFAEFFKNIYLCFCLTIPILAYVMIILYRRSWIRKGLSLFNNPVFTTRIKTPQYLFTHKNEYHFVPSNVVIRRFASKIETFDETIKVLEKWAVIVDSDSIDRGDLVRVLHTVIDVNERTVQKWYSIKISTKMGEEFEFTFKKMEKKSKIVKSRIDNIYNIKTENHSEKISEIIALQRSIYNTELTLAGLIL